MGDVFAGWSQPTAAQAAARAAIPTQALGALSRLKHAHTTPSDGDQELLAPFHELAAVISGTTTSVTTVGVGSLSSRHSLAPAGTPNAGLVAASAACGWVEATENRNAGWPDYSWEYSWHNHLDTCWNGSIVTHLNSVYVYVNHIQTGWNYRGDVSSSIGSAGGWQLQDFKQSRMEFCALNYGCFQSLYPSAQIIQYGNGANAISRQSTG